MKIQVSKPFLLTVCIILIFPVVLVIATNMIVYYTKSDDVIDDVYGWSVVADNNPRLKFFDRWIIPLRHDEVFHKDLSINSQTIVLYSQSNNAYIQIAKPQKWSDYISSLGVTEKLTPGELFEAMSKRYVDSTAEPEIFMQDRRILYKPIADGFGYFSFFTTHAQDSSLEKSGLLKRPWRLSEFIVCGDEILVIGISGDKQFRDDFPNSVISRVKCNPAK